MPDDVRLPNEIQGGAFYKGDLYLATNIDTAVWKVLEIEAFPHLYSSLSPPVPSKEL